jgi:hypothetical protein
MLGWFLREGPGLPASLLLGTTVTFKQLMQTQALVHSRPALKHSQYRFWHWVFVQRQPLETIAFVTR